jgi:hypothetical protein
MLTAGAKRLSWAIAKDLKVESKENDAVDHTGSWEAFAAKHAAVAAVAYWMWNRKSKL